MWVVSKRYRREATMLTEIFNPGAEYCDLSEIVPEEWFEECKAPNGPVYLVAYGIYGGNSFFSGFEMRLYYGHSGQTYMWRDGTQPIGDYGTRNVEYWYRFKYSRPRCPWRPFWEKALAAEIERNIPKSIEMHPLHMWLAEDLQNTYDTMTVTHPYFVGHLGAILTDDTHTPMEDIYRNPGAYYVTDVCPKCGNMGKLPVASDSCTECLKSCTND